MRKYWPAVLVSSLLATSAVAQGAAQAGAAAPMAEAAVGTSVAERALQGAAESFPAGTERVYCFARITNVPVDGEVEFVWFKGDAEQARVKQTVKSSPYRTWSSKTLPADAAGDWRCDVIQGEKVLQSVKFKIG
jgi:hypothetical protein